MLYGGRLRVCGILIAAVTMSFTGLLVAGCTNNHVGKQAAVAIEKGDTCAVCGMYIMAYGGPRGEAYVDGYKKPLKFGSTRDFFAYVTQPEHASQLESLFVQDVSKIDWKHPSNRAETFIDARKATYVAWQPLPGAMGPTFASFAKVEDAQAFVKKYGGVILSFNDITPEMISKLGYNCPARGSDMYEIAKGCVQKHIRIRMKGMEMIKPTSGMSSMKNMGK